jgi:hypothetical protein
MKTLTYKLTFFALLSVLFFGCGKEGPQGPAGLDTEVYYSDWFYPSSWSGSTGDWYFDVNAPDLTSSIVESGLILGYVSFSTADVYDATVRPMPCWVDGANWDFLIPGVYKQIEFTSDASSAPSTYLNPIKFRYIAIPGNIPALKSASIHGKSVSELKSMPYKDVCKLFNIPE